MGSFLKYICFCFVFIGILQKANAQNPSIDSLKLALKNATHDTTRCNILELLSETASDDEWPLFNEQLLKLAELNSQKTSDKTLKLFYLDHVAYAINNMGFLSKNNGDIPGAIKLFERALKIQEITKVKKGYATTLNNLAVLYSDIDNSVKALDYYNQCLSIQLDLDDKEGIAITYNGLANTYKHFGDIPKALDFFHKALKIGEETKDKLRIATSLNDMASIYSQQGDGEKALDYYEQALKINLELNDAGNIANSYHNLAATHLVNKNDKLVIEYNNKALKLYEKNNNKEGIAATYVNFGYLYNQQKNYNLSLEYYTKALKLYEEQDNKVSLCFSLGYISDILRTLKQYDKAKGYALRNFQLSKEIGYPEIITNAAFLLKLIYKKQNNYKLAYEMLALETKMRDSIDNQETHKAAIKKQMQYDYDKKELLLKAEQDKKDILASEELKQKEKERNYFIAGFSLVMILALFIFRGYKQKQKDNKLITLQKQLVEEKQKEIIDSIHYAKRIQTALMTNENYIDKNLNRLNK